MSQRERPGASGSAHPTATASNPALPPPAGRNGDLPSAPGWETLFPALTNAQQQVLLDLAARQGCVYGSQIPDLAAIAERGRALISSMLGGSTDDPIGPACIAPIAPIDSALDAWQLDAVAKAVDTPDLCLIQGAAGTGKSRVIAEIIRQAVGKGQRVLLVAPHAAALDVVIARIGCDSDLLVMRCLARDEQADRLSPASIGFTLAAHRKRLLENTKLQVRQSADERGLRMDRVRRELPALERLCELAQRRHDLESNLAEPCPAPAEGDAFSRDLAVAQSDCETNLNRLDEATRAAAAKLQSVQKEIADLDARVVAAERAAADRGWIAKFFHFSANRYATEMRECQVRLEALRVSESQAKLRAEGSALERQQLAGKWEAERRRRIDDEMACRRIEHEKRGMILKEELTRLKPEIDRAAAEMHPDGGLTAASELNAIVAACESNRRLLDQDQREAEFARRWSEFLTENAEHLASRLLSCVNVAAAPLGALASDDVMAELARSKPFDLLIVDEADRVSETELNSALHFGRRWVLVGESVAAASGTSADADERNNGGDSGRNGRRSGHGAPARRPGSPRSSPWPRLWHQLHTESWRIHEERLCARLMPLTDAHQSALESEPVADSPDVELRIWTPAAGPPALAEVRFPASTPLRQALTFLHTELGEIPVGAGPLCWSERGGRVQCQLLPPTPSPDTAPVPSTELVELEPGLWTRIAASDGGWRLASIEFDVAAGWGRERAEAWVRQSLHVADFGRTARLPIVHRMEPALAAFLASLGFARPNSSMPADATNPAVEFIPVPALANEPQARRRGDVGLSGQQRRLPPLRGGAGFEIDLADPRQRERLPTETQAHLPDRGFVNPSEAHAVVRLLENLIDDLPANIADRPASIAVLPLYEAQAEFIRDLVAHSPILSAAPLPVYIAVPHQFRQREAEIVLISLTRSHSHRAVSYGKDAEAVPLALMRARRQLVLVGDPGTLARRAQWDGPLEHLDETASRREKDWVAALVRQLQGLGAPSVQLREGPP